MSALHGMKGGKPSLKIALLLAAFVIAEALTLYAYSLLWLIEGQPQYHGDPKLTLFAWVCVGAMFVEFALFLHFVRKVFNDSFPS